MFALISHVLDKMIPRKDLPAHDEYLASSTDLADLERRMRQIDEEDHAYSLSFCGALARDRNTFSSN